MGDVDFGDLAVRMLTTYGDEKNLVSFQACWLALKDEAALPLLWRTPQPWSDQDSNQMRGLRDLTEKFGPHFNFEAFRVSAEAACAPFAKWRNAVHDHEGLQAGRLTTLVWAYRTLFKLRDVFDDPAPADALLAKAGECIDTHWKLGATFPVEGEYREWATRATRRYDLLPKVWRFV